MSKRFEETYYGLVLGLRQKYDDRGQWIWKTEGGQIIVNKANETCLYYELFSKTATVLNKTANYLITEHDGTKDQSCEYNGLHYHVIAKLRCHPTRDARWGRSLVELCKKMPHMMFFCCQQVQSVPALARHILTQPRKLMAVKGIELEAHSSTAGPEGYMAVIPNDKAKIGADKNYYRIRYLS